MTDARKEFLAFRAEDAQTLATMRECYEKTGYIVDPHTAVGMVGAQEILNKTSGAVVVLATAHPAKFPDAVEKAIGQRPELPTHLADLFTRKEAMTELPNDLKTVQDFVRSNRQP